MGWAWPPSGSHRKPKVDRSPEASPRSPAIVQALAECHFSQYLQRRNPNVPGIVNKPSAPIERDLRLARQFWEFVRDRFHESGEPQGFRNIYSDQLLPGRLTFDRFLPWSFVAHDLLWNLVPVDASTNSSKGDALPDLETHLPRLVSLHVRAIALTKQRPRLLEDYTEAFKLDVPGLLALGEDGLCAKYRDLMTSQVQIAANQGFPTGWKLPSLIVLSEPRQSLSLEPRRDDRCQRQPQSTGIVVEHFPAEAPTEPSVDHLPYYSLAIAAGGFRQGDEPEPEGWVNVRKLGHTKRLATSVFITQVVGKSMEPTIRDNAYCVFRTNVGGTRQHRILLVQEHDFTDRETGGGYTGKRYASQKLRTEDGWSHERIRLVPDNPDRTAFPILEFTPTDDEDLRVIAEFVQMIGPAD